MAKPQTQKELVDSLTKRAIKFYDFYGDELESISQILKIRLGGLASAYTVKTIFLVKLLPFTPGTNH